MMRSYRSGLTDTPNFVHVHTSFPATEEVVYCFVVKLHIEGVARTSNKTYISSSNTALPGSNFKLAMAPLCTYVIRGCKKAVGKGETSFQ